MADPNKYHNGRNGFLPFNGNGNNHDTNHYSNHNQNSPDKDEDEIDLKKLFYLLYNRKWLIIGTVIICGILGGVVAHFTTPIYKSEGTIMIANVGKNWVLHNQGGISNILSSAFGLGTSSTLMNEMQILKSRKLSRAVADTIEKNRP